jgi:hypothetical protein
MFMRYACFVLLFVISSCGKTKRQTSIPLVNQGVLQSKLHNRLGHAKHFDIPIPLGFNLNQTPEKTSPDNTNFICYTGNLSVGQTAAFYAREMEHSGWSVRDFSNTLEALLLCTKPTKSCAVSIRKNMQQSKKSPGKTLLYLFIQEDSLSC